LAVLSMTVLVGCVPLQQSPRHAAHSTVSTNSTVLFSVTLTSASAPDREPTGLVVDVESQSGAIRKQFAFTPNSRIPGHHTTFLVRLDLPAGAYGIPQLSGIAADGKPIPQFDVAPQMTFNIRPKATSYIGHVELSKTDGSKPAGHLKELLAATAGSGVKVRIVRSGVAEFTGAGGDKACLTLPATVDDPMKVIRGAC